ncbi:unnamed protein product [Hapterophycus canaliculatus]
MWGPVVGTRHDSYILAQSELMQNLSTLNSEGGAPFYLYGDPAYGSSNYLICPYSAASAGELTPQIADFNSE